MTADEDADRHVDLISRFIDGEWSAEVVDGLREMLRDSDTCREAMVDQLLLDSLLQEELGPESLTALVDVVGAAGLAAAATPGGSPEPTAALRDGGRRWRHAGWLALAVGLAGMVFGVVRWEVSSVAKAAAVIQAAEGVHAERLERIYEVEVEKGDGQASFVPPRDVRVATQGDRFFVTMSRGEKQWFWGRDAAGAIWITVGPRRALIVGNDEVGPPLRHISDLYALNIETLLQNFRKHCELVWSRGPTGSHVIVVTPRLRGARGVLRQATIEVDPETKVIRRLVLDREIPKLGKSVTTFTLVDTRPAEHAAYSPAGHLEEPSVLLTRDARPDSRRSMLVGWFGPAADRWIVTPEDSDNDR